MVLMILVFLALVVLGTPIAFAIGIAAALAIVYTGTLPLMLVPHRMVTQLNANSLLAVPYFVLAGHLMENGGISERLFRFSNALTGHWRGGIAQSSMVASIIMSGLTGSGVADISAIGAVAVPGMKRKGYKPAFIAAVLSSGGFLGPIFPPSILMIVYGSITQISIGRLFMSGVVPGLILGVSFMAMIWLLSGRYGYVGEGRLDLREIGRSFVAAFWALIAPVVLVGGIVSGVFTPTEAGAVAAVYSFIVGSFIYRQLKPSQYLGILAQTGMMTGAVLIILATAAEFGWLLERMRFPEMTVEFLLSITSSPSVVMLLIVLAVLIIGMVIETLAAAIILIPVLDPLGAQFGFNPLHFAFVIVLALQLGTVHPPVGVYLFLANRMAGGRLDQSTIEMLPFIAIMVLMLFVVAFVPPLATFLPRLIYGN